MEDREAPLLPAAGERRWRPVVVLLPTFFYFIAGFVNQAGMSLYVNERTCEDLHNITACLNDGAALSEAERREVSAAAAALVMAIVLSNTAASLLMTGFWSASTDVAGRRPILMLPCMCGMLTSSGLTAIVFTRASLRWLPLLFGVGALGGGFGSFCAAMYAHVTDVIPGTPERARAFAMLQAACFLGQLLGPALGGALYAFHVVAPSTATFGLFASGLLCVCCLGPDETAPDAKLRRLFSGGAGALCLRSWAPLALLARRADGPASSLAWWCAIRPGRPLKPHLPAPSPPRAPPTRATLPTSPRVVDAGAPSCSSSSS